MKAMILAAGRGERLRPLTDDCPKPLLSVAGKPLIAWHVEALANAGFREIVINLGHLGNMIPAALGDGERFGVRLQYSDETLFNEPLETGGGIKHALPLLGRGPFLVINGDTWSDFPIHRLRSNHCEFAHLVLVDNPIHNPGGDFTLRAGRAGTEGEKKLTFSGMAIYHPRFFADSSAGRFSVVPLLKEAMRQNQVTAEHHEGAWFDMGTPERLHLLRQALEPVPSQ